VSLQPETWETARSWIVQFNVDLRCHTRIYHTSLLDLTNKVSLSKSPGEQMIVLASSKQGRANRHLGTNPRSLSFCSEYSTASLAHGMFCFRLETESSPTLKEPNPGLLGLNFEDGELLLLGCDDVGRGPASCKSRTTRINPWVVKASWVVVTCKGIETSGGAG
jgi:hypothetical protein